MKKRHLVPLVALLVCACGARAHTIQPENLAHSSYVLSEVDGAPFAARTPPVLSFAGDMRVSGSICNSFTGQAELRDNVLTARNLASTRKMCFDTALNALETDFLRALGAGAEAALDGENLTLRQGERSFTYRRSR